MNLIFILSLELLGDAMLGVVSLVGVLSTTCSRLETFRASDK